MNFGASKDACDGKDENPGGIEQRDNVSSVHDV